MRVTIREAIGRADELRPNTLSPQTKMLWLRQLDAVLRRSVVVLHEPDSAEEADGLPAPGADLAADCEAELLAGEPDTALYLYWLMAQADLAEGEITRYANNMQLYNAALADFTAHYKASHRPLPRGQFRL